MTPAQRIAELVELEEPWPHGILDDFLPAEAFAELIDALPVLCKGTGRVRKSTDLPASVRELLAGDEMEAAIRGRYGFSGAKPSLEVVYRESGLKPHSDRRDKPWSGLIYLAGDPQGTELYDTDGHLVKTIEWKPNRLVCWSLRPPREQHAVPESRGRYVLVWWLLKS